MSNEILLSFVIPVYNVEDYLKICIDSIVNQIDERCEIILVDDGSTDASGSICDHYHENDSRVKTLHKENGGLSSARNAGLLVAKGKYVTFIDSDDYISDSSISGIINWIETENADVCFLRSVKLYPDGTTVDLEEKFDRTRLLHCKKEDALRYIASRSKFPGSAWGKLFKREFLVINDLHFPYDRRYSEDLGFMRDCLIYAQSFDSIDAVYYFYRQNRKGSITYKFSPKNYHDLYLFIDESERCLTSNKIHNDEISKIVMGFVAYEYMILLYLYGVIEDGRKEALKKLKDSKWVLKYARNRKVRIVATVCNICGIRICSYLLRKYRKISAK